MAYERMTLSSFSENLKAGKYDTATGARRAVGKANDWSTHDKNLAAGAINTHFGADDAKAAPRATKTAKVAKKAAKKTAVKAAAPVAAKKAAKTAPAKRAVSRRTPTMKSVVLEEKGAADPDPGFMLPIRTVAPALIGEAVLRQNNASNIVVALAALQSRTPEEQTLYTKAMGYASSSFDATAPVAAPKPFVSLREQMAAAPPTGPSRADPKALAQADAAARALVGPEYGQISTNSVATPLG
jgi:hypothetical protein